LHIEISVTGEGVSAADLHNWPAALPTAPWLQVTKAGLQIL